MGKSILISGAGVAGPTLAWWLARYGFEVTVVERAPALRDGGQAVDFRGPAHLGVLEQMGVLDEIRARQTHMGATAFVDARGRPLVTMSAEFLGGDVEILRGDLGKVLYEATRDTAEYIFGDAIASLSQDEDGVDVAFERAPPRRFDLVVGADGLHSNVRRLAFGDEARFIRDFGYSVAIFTIPNVYGLDREGRIYCAPGRAAGVFGGGDGGEVRASLYFTSPPGIGRGDLEGQKRRVAEAFAGMGWETPRLIAAMAAARDFYMDTISQVRMDRWSDGRVVLVGDAGYGGTLGGMGTGLAVIAAYVLAGELAASPNDRAAAFARYAEAIGDYARTCQKGAASVGRFMAPKTRAGIALRNGLLWSVYHLPGKGLMETIAASRAEGIALKPYAQPLTEPARPASRCGPRPATVR
jgi:2-polyprenyl-6-methoxyphenol hydroxylase-like FAD-dependent oxidoreductase